MSLFPFATDTEVTLSTQEITASAIREYEIDFKNGRLTGKIVEGVDALCVWAYLAIITQRYKWVIYSWYYGSEHTNLIAHSYSEEYLRSETQRYLEECLFENEHIIGVEELEVKHINDKLSVRFNMITDVGSKEVDMYV